MNEGDAHGPQTGLDWIPELDHLLFYERNGNKVRVIARVASEWEKLALALSIEAYIMRTIKRNHGNSCEDACTDLLKRWLEGNYHTYVRKHTHTHAHTYTHTYTRTHTHTRTHHTHTGEGREPKTWSTLVEALMEIPDVETVSAISDVLNQ